MRMFFARIQGFIKYKDLMGQLVLRDLKLKYRRSILGYLWSILNPLFIMTIMAIVFSQMFRSTTIPNYPVYLMSGQVLFNYMNISTQNTYNCIRINGNKSKCHEKVAPVNSITINNAPIEKIQSIRPLVILDTVKTYLGR